MAREKERETGGSSPEQVISIIGPGMTITGDCDTDGAVRIEGLVKGNIRAGKAVVVGKEGSVEGDIRTQDAVISGHIKGSIRAESRLEIHSTTQLEGEVSAGRMQVEEGAQLNGTVNIGAESVEPKRTPVSKAKPVEQSED